jgi:hypothetical protein
MRMLKKLSYSLRLLCSRRRRSVPFVAPKNDLIAFMTRYERDKRAKSVPNSAFASHLGDG